LKQIKFQALGGTLIESILIPSNLEILDSFCFFGCHSLKSITFESSSKLKQIERQAFGGTLIESILIPSNLEILDSDCFFGCHSLKLITFESSSKLKRIKSNAFSGTSIESMMILSNVEILDSDCFSDCHSLKSITFESSSKFKRIERRDLSSFPLLHEVVLSRALTADSPSAFLGCSLSLSVEFQLNSLAHEHLFKRMHARLHVHSDRITVAIHSPSTKDTWSTLQTSALRFSKGTHPIIDSPAFRWIDIHVSCQLGGPVFKFVNVIRSELAATVCQYRNVGSGLEMR
jgi:hypothetical protein